MRIKLKVQLTGTRNGQPWPEYGEEIDLPDDEASSMVAAGMAEAAGGQPKDETSGLSARDALVPKRTVKGK